MARLPQKCFAASAGVHALLLVVLFVGPAFLSSKSKVDNSRILDVIPTKLIDAAFSGGGNPNGTPPPLAPPIPRPQTPTPAPPAPPAPPPEPPREASPPRPDPRALEPTPDRKSRLPDVSTKMVSHKRDNGKATKSPTTPSTTDSADQRVADARKRAAALIGATARSLREDMSPGTTIEPLGPGGGGEVYAPYDQAVQSIYWHAWKPPQDTASDAAVTKATVVIASDGTVLSARIIKPSGDASVDRSVQQALDRVTYIAPFPEGAKEKQRTYTIKFDLKARRLTG